MAVSTSANTTGTKMHENSIAGAGNGILFVHAVRIERLCNSENICDANIDASYIFPHIHKAYTGLDSSAICSIVLCRTCTTRQCLCKFQYLLHHPRPVLSTSMSQNAGSTYTRN
jgi:hypothetical protein